MRITNTVLCTTALACGGLAVADTITLDLAGVDSWDSFGSLNNVTELFALGDVTITGLGWDNVVGNGDDSGLSWGNEMSMYVADSGNLEGVTVGFFPSEGSGSAGGVWGPASSGGIVDLVAVGLDFTTSSGSLLVEFYESYDDSAGSIDAHYESGTVTIEYQGMTPAVPGLGGIAALAGIGLFGRRRR